MNSRSWPYHDNGGGSLNKADKFVAHLFEYKKTGSFLDIGCAPPERTDHLSTWSNSYALEKLGWKGICIDLSYISNWYRKAAYYNLDALKIDYNDFLNKSNMPKAFDYLSLDIDIPYTEKVLEKILESEYEFKVGTIEHDWYGLTERLPSREKMRDLLLARDYYPLCSDVWFHKNEYFEDWWVNKKYFDIEKLTYLDCDKKHFTDIMRIIDQKENYDNG